MGLKSNVKPGPIEVQESNETTPSVTPMRPTPLVGNWCDLPWAGDDGVTGTPSKLGLMGGKGSFLLSNVVASSTPAKPPVEQFVTAAKILDPLALHIGMPQMETTPLPRTDTAEGVLADDDDDTMNDLYLVTPMDTLAAEDFEMDMAATADFQATPAKEAEDAEDAEEVFALPSRASHFVDFRRLQQQKSQQQLATTAAPPVLTTRNTVHHQPTPNYTVQQAHSIYQVPYPAPMPHPVQPVRPQQQQQQLNYATAQGGYYPTTANVAVPYPVGCPMPPPPPQRATFVGQHPAHGAHGVAPASQCRPPSVVVLISRFPPPPPPSKQSMEVLLRTGSCFQSYYTIVMRWYEKVLRSTPKAHPNVPPCPAAELYLHDFEGWVEQIGLWWSQHFTRRPKGQPQHSRSNTAGGR